MLIGLEIRKVGALLISVIGGLRQRLVPGRAWIVIGWSYAMVVGRSLEISSDMDLIEDTWSEVSSGSPGILAKLLWSFRFKELIYCCLQQMVY